MCGIVAYTGFKPAAPILLDGLHSLEYRGYDSVGMYIPNVGVYKTVGRVDALADKIPPCEHTAGIAHTRWATYGQPSFDNAHPHTDQKQRIWLVHNGMIENHEELKTNLQRQGHTFYSETDTEVLAHLIGAEYEKTNDLPEAVTSAVSEIRGTYGIAVMSVDDPKTIVTARMGSPIFIGIKDGEFLVASDTAPMLKHTSNVVNLKDGEYAIVTPESYKIYSFDHKRLRRSPQTLDLALESAKRIDRPHHMLKDILELPFVLENSVRGRILKQDGNAKLGGLQDYASELKNLKRVIIVGCGSSHFSSHVGKLLIEDYAHIPVEVEYGSEFCNRPCLVSQKDTAVLFISQSGETPDIIRSIRKAKQAGLRTIGIVNVVGSTISKEIDMGIYNYAGPEVGVTSTKGFISQLEVLTLVALYLGRLKDLSQARGAELALEILQIPDKVRAILARRNEIKQLAEEYLGYDDFLFIGREYNIATAYEGALKLKKVSYVHAEGFPAGEIKHGPIAMLNDIFPTIAIMPSDSTYEDMCTDVSEIRNRQGPVLAIATEGNAEVRSLADDVFYIPDTKACLTPILATIPLQLFAYYTGALRGFNVEEPRRASKIIFDS